MEDVSEIDSQVAKQREKFWKHIELRHGIMNFRTSHYFILFCFVFAFELIQFSSVAQSCPILCDPMNHNTLGLPVHQQLLEFTQTHVH